VHGEGLDEMTTTGVTQVAALEDGEVRTFEISPEDVGLPRARPEDLKGGDAEHNAEALKAVLAGEKGAYRDIAVLNAAGALVVARRARTLEDGMKLAAQSIDRGRAMAALERLVEVSRGEGSEA
jgi:anthranilate phosphoribosyltransferase